MAFSRVVQVLVAASKPTLWMSLLLMGSVESAPANQQFFRKGSTLVPVILSSHDDRTANPQQVASTFKSELAESMLGLKVVSLIIKPTDKSCLARYNSVFQEGMGEEESPALQQLSQSTGGLVISVCDEDFSKSIAKIPEALAQPMTSLALSHEPLASSLKISFMPATTVSWSLFGRTVTFAKPLPPGTKITLSYLVP